MIYDLLYPELAKSLAQLCLAERWPDQEKLFQENALKALEDGLDPIRDELFLRRLLKTGQGCLNPLRKVISQKTEYIL